VAGIANNLTSLVTSSLDRSHKKAERLDEQIHEQKLRSAQYHDEARDTYIPVARELLMWSEDLLAEHIRLNMMWMEPLRPAGYSTPSHTRVAELLLQLVHEHPTRSVRQKASSLLDAVTTVWATEDGHEKEFEADEDDARAWHTAAEDILDEVHVPPVGS
jgi:hypothetical protein